MIIRIHQSHDNYNTHHLTWVHIRWPIGVILDCCNKIALMYMYFIYQVEYWRFRFFQWAMTTLAAPVSLHLSYDLEIDNHFNPHNNCLWQELLWLPSWDYDLFAENWLIPTPFIEANKQFYNPYHGCPTNKWAYGVISFMARGIGFVVLFLLAGKWDCGRPTCIVVVKCVCVPQPQQSEISL